MRVLVADDHEAVRAGIVRIVRSSPTFSVCGEAEDGLDAVKQAAAAKPDLVLLDISMPHLDGFGAAEQIKRVLPSCHIVIVSQHDSPEAHRQAMRVGAIAYIVKSELSTQLPLALTAIKQKFGPANCVDHPEPSGLAETSPANVESPPSRPPVNKRD